MRVPVVFLFLIAGCGIDYPKEIWIDSRFTPREEEVIHRAMGRWEEQTGRDLFAFRGRINTPPFRKEELGDGRFVIHRVENINEGDASIIWNFEDPGYGDGGHSGWATSADMLIFIPKLYSWNQDFYRQRLFSLLLHEFGHALFLGHIKDYWAVMRPGGGSRHVCLTALDLEAFCSLNFCDENFSPEQSEIECRRTHGKEESFELD